MTAYFPTQWRNTNVDAYENERATFLLMLYKTEMFHLANFLEGAGSENFAFLAGFLLAFIWVYEDYTFSV